MFFKVVSLLVSSFVLLSCHPKIEMSNIINYQKSVLPFQSFVKISRLVKVKICIGTKCIERIGKSNGSGSIITKKSRAGQYVLTAGHMCEKSEISLFEEVSSKIVIRDFDDNEHEATIVKIDSENDICLLLSSTLNKPSIMISSNPLESGERIYNVAAPGGVFFKQVVPVFEGIFSGTTYDKKYDVYSIFGAPGSSGSMVLNYRGYLVGIIVEGYRGINVMRGPNYDIIKKFLFSVLKKC